VQALTGVVVEVLLLLSPLLVDAGAEAVEMYASECSVGHKT